MLNFILLLLGFISGGLIATGFYILFAMHRIEDLEKQGKDILNKKTIGNLRIDRSDPESPYMFAELTSGVELHDGDQVVMNVVDRNYISDSQ